MSVRAISIPQRNKALRNNMLQGRRICINIGFDDQLIVKEDESSVYRLLDVPALITSSDMHLTFSNCFDQYKVVSYILQINVKGIRTVGFDIEEAHDEYGVIFSLFDRTKIKDSSSWATFKTYQSYVETQIPMSGSNVRPAIRTIRSNTQYTDTKNMATIPYLYYGIGFTGGTFPGDIYFDISINIKADVYYRGVRYDESYVNTRLNPMIKRSTPANTITQYVPTYRDYLYINKLQICNNALVVVHTIDLDNDEQDDPFTEYPNGLNGYTFVNNGVYIALRRIDNISMIEVSFSYQVAGTTINLGNRSMFVYVGDRLDFDDCHRCFLCYNDIRLVSLLDSNISSVAQYSTGRYDFGFIRFRG